MYIREFISTFWNLPLCWSFLTFVHRHKWNVKQIYLIMAAAPTKMTRTVLSKCLECNIAKVFTAGLLMSCLITTKNKFKKLLFRNKFLTEHGRRLTWMKTKICLIIPVCLFQIQQQLMRWKHLEKTAGTGLSVSVLHCTVSDT